jgi:hypothetical protein
MSFIRRISPMSCFPARWTTTLAAAALLTLPLAVSAQSTDTKIDATASKRHLSAARDTLSQLTSMPEAARLQGDARTQVSQIISSFNELITTQSDWRAAYAKVDAGLTAVLGPDAPEPAPPATPPSTGVPGAVGTAGSAAATLDPAIRAKLVEFRTHLKAFEKSAGGSESGTMAPSLATDGTANPANPAVAPTPAAAPPNQAQAPAPATQAQAPEQAGPSEADRHLDAISAILDQSQTGTLTKAQTDSLKKHVAELRLLLAKKLE